MIHSIKSRALFQLIPEAVLLDPLSKRLDGSDASKCLVVEWVKKSAIKAQYGEDATDFEVEVQPIGKISQMTRIGELLNTFYKEDVSDELLLLEDGSIAFKSELSEDDEAFAVEDSTNQAHRNQVGENIRQ